MDTYKFNPFRLKGNEGWRWGTFWLGSACLPDCTGFPELLQVQFNAFNKLIVKFDGIDKLKLIGSWVPSGDKKLKIVIFNLTHGELTRLQPLKMIKEPFHHKNVTLSWLFGIALLLQLLRKKLQVRTDCLMLMFEPWREWMPPLRWVFPDLFFPEKINSGLPSVRRKNHSDGNVICFGHDPIFIQI